MGRISRRRKVLPILFALLLVALIWIDTTLHYKWRWLWSARSYKASVLSQPERPNEWKHVEWDGWGFAGQNTDVYLVFDPTDGLATAARDGLPGKIQRHSVRSVSRPTNGKAVVHRSVLHRQRLDALFQ